MWISSQFGHCDRAPLIGDDRLVLDRTEARDRGGEQSAGSVGINSAEISAALEDKVWNRTVEEERRLLVGGWVGREIPALLHVAQEVAYADGRSLAIEGELHGSERCGKLDRG